MGQVRRSAGLSVCALVLAAGVASAANPYPPPSRGSAQVVPSRIRAGQCAVFSGNGFRGVTPVTVSDNGATRSTTTADASGSFSQRLCYGTTAPRGRHVLQGSGTGSDGAPLTVSAVLIVEGVRQSASNPSTLQGGQAAPVVLNNGADQPVLGATDPGGSSPSAPGTAVVGSPQPVAEGASTPAPQGGFVAAPRHGDNSGARALILGLTATGAVFLSSLLLLLLARRRSRRQQAADGASLTNA